MGVATAVARLGVLLVHIGRQSAFPCSPGAWHSTALAAFYLALSLPPLMTVASFMAALAEAELGIQLWTGAINYFLVVVPCLAQLVLAVLLPSPLGSPDWWLTPLASALLAITNQGAAHVTATQSAFLYSVSVATAVIDFARQAAQPTPVRTSSTAVPPELVAQLIRRVLTLAMLHASLALSTPASNALRRLRCGIRLFWLRRHGKEAQDEAQQLQQRQQQEQQRQEERQRGLGWPGHGAAERWQLVAVRLLDAGLLAVRLMATSGCGQQTYGAAAANGVATFGAAAAPAAAGPELVAEPLTAAAVLAAIQCLGSLLVTSWGATVLVVNALWIAWPRTHRPRYASVVNSAASWFGFFTRVALLVLLTSPRRKADVADDAGVRPCVRSGTGASSEQGLVAVTAYVSLMLNLMVSGMPAGVFGMQSAVATSAAAMLHRWMQPSSSPASALVVLYGSMWLVAVVLSYTLERGRRQAATTAEAMAPAAVATATTATGLQHETLKESGLSAAAASLALLSEDQLQALFGPDASASCVLRMPPLVLAQALAGSLSGIQGSGRGDGPMGQHALANGPDAADAVGERVQLPSAPMLRRNFASSDRLAAADYPSGRPALLPAPTPLPVGPPTAIAVGRLSLDRHLHPASLAQQAIPSAALPGASVASTAAPVPKPPALTESGPSGGCKSTAAGSSNLPPAPPPPTAIPLRMVQYGRAGGVAATSHRLQSSSLRRASSEATGSARVPANVVSAPAPAASTLDAMLPDASRHGVGSLWGTPSSGPALTDEGPHAAPWTATAGVAGGLEPARVGNAQGRGDAAIAGFGASFGVPAVLHRTAPLPSTAGTKKPTAPAEAPLLPPPPPPVATTVTLPAAAATGAVGANANEATSVLSTTLLDADTYDRLLSSVSSPFCVGANPGARATSAANTGSLSTAASLTAGRRSMQGLYQNSSGMLDYSPYDTAALAAAAAVVAAAPLPNGSNGGGGGGSRLASTFMSTTGSLSRATAAAAAASAFALGGASAGTSATAAGMPVVRVMRGGLQERGEDMTSGHSFSIGLTVEDELARQPRRSRGGRGGERQSSDGDGDGGGGGALSDRLPGLSGARHVIVLPDGRQVYRSETLAAAASWSPEWGQQLQAPEQFHDSSLPQPGTGHLPPMPQHLQQSHLRSSQELHRTAATQDVSARAVIGDVSFVSGAQATAPAPMRAQNIVSPFIGTAASTAAGSYGVATDNLNTVDSWRLPSSTSRLHNFSPSSTAAATAFVGAAAAGAALDVGGGRVSGGSGPVSRLGSYTYSSMPPSPVYRTQLLQSRGNMANLAAGVYGIGSSMGSSNGAYSNAMSNGAFSAAGTSGATYATAETTGSGISAAAGHSGSGGGHGGNRAGGGGLLPYSRGSLDLGRHLHETGLIRIGEDEALGGAGGGSGSQFADSSFTDATGTRPNSSSSGTPEVERQLSNRSTEGSRNSGGGSGGGNSGKSRDSGARSSGGGSAMQRRGLPPPVEQQAADGNGWEQQQHAMLSLVGSGPPAVYDVGVSPAAAAALPQASVLGSGPAGYDAGGTSPAHAHAGTSASGVSSGASSDVKRPFRMFKDNRSPSRQAHLGPQSPFVAHATAASASGSSGSGGAAASNPASASRLGIGGRRSSADPLRNSNGRIAFSGPNGGPMGQESLPVFDATLQGLLNTHPAASCSGTLVLPLPPAGGSGDGSGTAAAAGGVVGLYLVGANGCRHLASGGSHRSSNSNPSLMSLTDVTLGHLLPQLSLAGGNGGGGNLSNGASAIVNLSVGSLLTRGGTTAGSHSSGPAQGRNTAGAARSGSAGDGTSVSAAAAASTSAAGPTSSSRRVVGAQTLAHMTGSGVSRSDYSTGTGALASCVEVYSSGGGAGSTSANGYQAMNAAAAAAAAGAGGGGGNSSSRLRFMASGGGGGGGSSGILPARSGIRPSLQEVLATTAVVAAAVSGGGGSAPLPNASSFTAAKQASLLHYHHRQHSNSSNNMQSVLRGAAAASHAEEHSGSSAATAAVTTSLSYNAAHATPRGSWLGSFLRRGSTNGARAVDAATTASAGTRSRLSCDAQAPLYGSCSTSTGGGGGGSLLLFEEAHANQGSRPVADDTARLSPMQGVMRGLRRRLRKGLKSLSGKAGSE